MGRERNRILKRREKNAVEECNKIQKKYYPELFSKFAGVKDPRNSSYIDYRMDKAIHYAINQESHLRVFLTDGNICCDNGNAERKIRAYSVF